MFFFFNATATPEIYTLPYTTLFRSDGGDTGRRDRSGIWGTVAAGGGGGSAECGNGPPDRKSTRLNSSHRTISYAVFCLKKKKKKKKDKHKKYKTPKTLTNNKLTIAW